MHQCLLRKPLRSTCDNCLTHLYYLVLVVVGECNLAYVFAPLIVNIGFFKVSYNSEQAQEEVHDINFTHYSKAKAVQVKKFSFQYDFAKTSPIYVDVALPSSLWMIKSSRPLESRRSCFSFAKCKTQIK